MSDPQTIREIVALRQELFGIASDCPDVSAAILSTRAALDIAQDMAEDNSPTLPYAMATIRRRTAAIKAQSYKLKAAKHFPHASA